MPGVPRGRSLAGGLHVTATLADPAFAQDVKEAIEAAYRELAPEVLAAARGSALGCSELMQRVRLAALYVDPEAWGREPPAVRYDPHQLYGRGAWEAFFGGFLAVGAEPEDALRELLSVLAREQVRRAAQRHDEACAKVRAAQEAVRAALRAQQEADGEVLLARDLVEYVDEARPAHETLTLEGVVARLQFAELPVPVLLTPSADASEPRLILQWQLGKRLYRESIPAIVVFVDLVIDRIRELYAGHSEAPEDDADFDA
jgi:hypothetical protein